MYFFTARFVACVAIGIAALNTIDASGLAPTYAVTTDTDSENTIGPSTALSITHGAAANFTETPTLGLVAIASDPCGNALAGTGNTAKPAMVPCKVAATAASSATPVVFYTDIVSGPNTGGENNKGIYLSIFGKNFGASAGMGTTTRVFINNVEVDNYRYLGVSKGRTDVQQITVQIGAVGSPAAVPLPIKVSVSGVDSNTDRTFTVTPGAIYFVNNVSGVDTTTTNTGGTFAAPFKSVQRKFGASISFGIDSAANAGAWGRVRAGDFIVIRGTGTFYTTNATTGVNNGFDNYFLETLNKSGCAVGTNCSQGGGTTSGPITIMGYPTEDVFINNPYNAVTDAGAISGADSTRIIAGFGHWINIVNLRIESGNHDGAINTQAGGTNWRIVNNELTCATAVSNTTAKGGGIAGDAHVTVSALGPSLGSFYLGNYIHDVFNGPDDGTSNFENHGFYIDGAGNYDIGYNRIENIRGGNGISMYANGTLGNNNVDGVSFHHNIIKNTGKHGINVADGSRNNVKIWNNIVYNTDLAGIRFNTTDLVSAKIYNNTFYNINRLNNAAMGAIVNNTNFISSTAVDIRNNIFVPVTGDYDSLDFNLKGTVTNNLWFNGTGVNPASAYSTSSLTTNPLFVSTAAANFRLQALSPAINSGTSAVSAVVSDDFERTGRPAGAGWDIGAFEFQVASGVPLNPILFFLFD